MNDVAARDPEAMRLRLAGVVGQSIVDGPGLRMAVFVQGCPHRCPGCHNPETHGVDGGREAAVADVLAAFDRNPLLAGITLSGGEPFTQADALALLAGAVRARGKTVWCFSGYTFEEVVDLAAKDRAVDALVAAIDVLVDGRYEQARRSLDLRFRGSANQRLIDLPASLGGGGVVEYWLEPF